MSFTDCNSECYAKWSSVAETRKVCRHGKVYHAIKLGRHDTRPNSAVIQRKNFRKFPHNSCNAWRVTLRAVIMLTQCKGHQPTVTTCEGNFNTIISTLPICKPQWAAYQQPNQCHAEAMKTTSFSSHMNSCSRYCSPQMPDTMPRSGSGKLAVRFVHHCIISAARLASRDLLTWNLGVLFVYIELIRRSHTSPSVVAASPCLVTAPLLKSITCLKIRLHWFNGICKYEKQIIPRWNWWFWCNTS